jgi:hypothetical protein
MLVKIIYNIVSFMLFISILPCLALGEDHEEDTLDLFNAWQTPVLTELKPLISIEDDTAGLSIESDIQQEEERIKK